MRVLPENLRNLLREPIGRLVNEKQLLKVLQGKKHIVSIGDQVTYTILKHDIEPVLCVVDFKTRRGKCSSDVINVIRAFGEKSIKVKNPPRCISDELWDIIKSAYNNMPSHGLRIEVEGEEDLASLAAIYLAPRDVTVIYGLPDKGVLVVKPSLKNKRKVKEILDKM